MQVYLLYLVFAAPMAVPLPNNGGTINTIAQKELFVNEYVTMESCKRNGRELAQSLMAPPHTFAFHCVPAYSESTVQEKKDE